MNTPICDFVREFGEKEAVRLHMPGHKGVNRLGGEKYDITEFQGADSLYEAEGIIAESERNASENFGCTTFYSTEGSSQCIRAMLCLATLYSKQKGEEPLILAGRNVHKTFVSAAVLLDFEYMWLYPEEETSILSCRIDGEALESFLEKAERKPTALYLTSPDYLGNVTDIKSVSEVCHKHGILLLVDNAHGAYLKFLSHSEHPIDLGADMCCDSAHKTLPVITGGAYLHISSDAPDIFTSEAKRALALFGSTSPSYLILQSLDGANAYLSDGYKERLRSFIGKVESLKDSLSSRGYTLVGDEPLKVTIAAKEYGYEGNVLAELLYRQNIICEFADRDFIVFMLTPENTQDDLTVLERALMSVPRKPAIKIKPPTFGLPEKVTSAREAAFAKAQVMPVSECAGKILSDGTIGCPPAVPIVVSGERISKEAVECFIYYGLDKLKVIE